MNDGSSQPAPGTAARPLAGVRVLDLSRIIAGPFAAQHLADLGAEIIKVERPEGDDARAYVFPAMWAGESTLFMAFNRGKRSVVLDLAVQADRAALVDLAARADVLVENFRPGVMARLGLDYATLAAINPRLVYCSVSGFGDAGPLAQAGANDLVAQAACGLMALNPAPDGRPQKVAPAVVDLFTATNAVIAILAALRERDATGRGRHVTTSLFECGLALLGYFATGAFAERAAGRPSDMAAQARATITVPNQAFRCADGWIVVACSNDAMFRRLAAGLGQPALADDARFRTNADRTTHMAALIALLDDAFSRDTRAAWAGRLGAQKVSVAEVMSPEEALDSAQAASLDIVRAPPHPRLTQYRTVAAPFRLDGSRPLADLPPPVLGEHTLQEGTDR